MEEDNSPKRLAYEVGMILSSVASHGPAALTTTSDPMYTAQLLYRLKRALEAVGNIHHEKRGQRPRYAPEDPHAEGEPIGWVPYVTCAGCNADWPCATASAMGHRSADLVQGDAKLRGNSGDADANQDHTNGRSM